MKFYRLKWHDVWDFLYLTDVHEEVPADYVTSQWKQSQDIIG